jgi:hypothetical protein
LKIWTWKEKNLNSQKNTDKTVGKISDFEKKVVYNINNPRTIQTMYGNKLIIDLW